MSLKILGVINVKTVDARNVLCPKPLIMSKSALNEMKAGEQLLIILDDKTACDNVKRFLNLSGCEISEEQNDSEFRLSVTVKEKTQTDQSQPALVSKPVVAISSSVMGQGSDELGKILIQALINTIESLEVKPSAIVFYNSGVFLTCDDSPVISTLKTLESSGINILVCGTCLDYFELKSKCSAGKISNMFEILTVLSESGCVIKP